MQKYLNNVGVVDEAGDIIVQPDAMVTVYDSGTLNLSTIYSDDGITPKANPFEVDDQGQFSFYAADGRYDIVISHASYKPVVLTDILIEDPTEPENMTMSYHLSTYDHTNMSVNTSAIASVASMANSADTSVLTVTSTADSSLLSNINANTSAIDSALSSSVSADTSVVTRLSAVDSSLTNTISDNLSTSISADTSVVSRLSTVDSSLLSSVDSNAVNISNEASVSTSADTSIVSRLESEISEVLPDQTAHGGHILYTDGSDPYWDDPSAGTEDLYVKKNKQTFDIDYTLNGDYNGSCVGPITIADTKTLTILDDAILVVL